MKFTEEQARDHIAKNSRPALTAPKVNYWCPKCFDRKKPVNRIGIRQVNGVMYCETCSISVSPAEQSLRQGAGGLCGCGGTFKMVEGPSAKPPIQAVSERQAGTTAVLSAKSGKDSGSGASAAPRRAKEQNYENHIVRKVQNPEPQRHETPTLDATGEGKEKGIHRATVRFTGYRVRPLDPDNFAGSVKDLLDGLRHAGLIIGDEPWRIILETQQVKVGSFKEEKTVIEIDG